MKMDDSWYMDWLWKEATNQEKKVRDKIYEYSPMFGDMLFESGTYSYDLLQCEYLDRETGEWVKSEFPKYEELEHFSYNFFRVKVEETENCNGYYNHKNQVICISPKCVEDKACILHEMIHLHESVINDLPLYLHDMLLWALYGKLKAQIPKLDEIISDHAHILTGSTLYSQGGLHDILFLLKSFDLDIRNHYPLGTVFAYGRADNFKEYDYID